MGATNHVNSKNQQILLATPNKNNNKNIFPSSQITPKRKNTGRNNAGAGGTNNTNNNQTASPSTPNLSTKGGQSNQKWDDMLQCLLLYILQQREKYTSTMNEEEKKEWAW